MIFFRMSNGYLCFLSTMSVSNRAAVIAVLLIILTADLGRFAAADDQTHSKNDEESAKNKGDNDLQNQNNIDGHGEQLSRYYFIT